MKCEYCIGTGTYDPFAGPTTECPKCKGTGQVGSADECHENHLDDGPNHGGVYGKPPLAGTYPDERAAAAQQARVRNAKFQDQAKAVCDSLMDKFVHVKFHPGLNRAAVEGEITESETFGPHLQSIKVSEGGYIHDICMGDVESITEVSTGTKLWESKRTRSPGPKFNVKVHVSTTIAGTAVRTGDSVEVRTDNGRATGRYVGILTAVNATDIGVEATHGTDYIPIDIIKRIIVTYSPGFAKGGLVQGGATHLASYPNLPGSWGVKEEPGDWLDDIASQLKITRKECRLLFAFGYPRGLGNIKLPIDLPHYPFMPEK